MNRFTPLQFQTIMYYSLDDKNYEHYLKLQKSISRLKKQYSESKEDVYRDDILRSLQIKESILELIIDRVFLNV